MTVGSAMMAQFRFVLLDKGRIASRNLNSGFIAITTSDKDASAYCYYFKVLLGRANNWKKSAEEVAIVIKCSDGRLKEVALIRKDQPKSLEAVYTIKLEL